MKFCGAHVSAVNTVAEVDDKTPESIGEVSLPAFRAEVGRHCSSMAADASHHNRTLVDGLASVGRVKFLATISFVWRCRFFAWSVLTTNYHPVVLTMALLGTILAIGY